MRTSIPTLLILTALVSWQCTPSTSTPNTFVCSDSTKQLILDKASSFYEMEEITDEVLQDYFDQLQEWENCNEPYVDSTLARLNDDIGKLFHANWKHEEATNLFKKAIQIRKTLTGPVHQKDIARMHYNIGLAYFRENKQHQAITHFDSARSATPEKFQILKILSNLKIGQSLERIGEREKALIHYEKAFLKATENNVSINRLLEITYSYLKCYRGLHLFKNGIDISNFTLNQLKSSDLCNRWGADVYMEIGNIWLDSMQIARKPDGSSDSVKKYYRKALYCYETSEGLGDGIRTNRINTVSLNLGEYYRRIDQPDEALPILNSTIALSERATLPKNLISPLLINRGETFYDLREYNSAKSDFTQALTSILQENEYSKNQRLATKLTSNYRLRDYQILILSNLARTQLAISKEDPTDTKSLSSAITIYDSLTSFIHRYRADLISEEAKMGLSSNIQKSLENAFSTAISLYKLTNEKEYLEQAFYFSEERKAFTLLEATRLNQFHGLLDEDDRIKEQALEKEQARLRTALQVNEGKPDMQALIQDSIAENFKQISLFNANLKQAYPKYFQLKTKGADLTIEQIQQELLDDDQAMLEYSYTPEILYLFLITQNDFQLREVSLENMAFEESLRSFKSIMSTGAERKKEGEEELIGKLGYQLYQLLIEPVASILPRRVMIIPDKELNTFPFEALVKKEGFSTPEDIADEEAFLIFDQSIAYCFSANLWWQMHQIQPRNASKLALINCEFNSDLHKNTQAQANLGTLASSKRFLKPLGRAQVDEMEGIEDKARRAKRLDQASKDDFLALCEKYGRIHLATHGIVHKSQQQLNYISFSQSADTLNVDQLLFLKDLLPYNWQMDFVFLSACQTASGEFIEGEGNMSLARGLAYAGVKSFVTTLWDVPTQPKADLVPRFYDHLLNNQEAKDVALQKAKMEVVYKYPHPSNWAGFSLSGSF